MAGVGDTNDVTDLLVGNVATPDDENSPAVSTPEKTTVNSDEVPTPEEMSALQQSPGSKNIKNFAGHACKFELGYDSDGWIPGILGNVAAEAVDYSSDEEDPALPEILVGEDWPSTNVSPNKAVVVDIQGVLDTQQIVQPAAVNDQVAATTAVGNEDGELLLVCVFWYC